VTGLLYLDSGSKDLHERCELVETPLNQLGDGDLCPGAAALDEVNSRLR
jgi:2-oxoglutarate/2-oxoacid ferredoxin oxidoreductase subunit beta